MNANDQAVIYFRGGYNCAQAVLLALSPGLGLEPDIARRITAAFGGGLARQGMVCGAVSGAAMALGLSEDASITDPIALKEHTYARVQQFLELFEARHQSLLCRELLGYDISNPEIYLQIREHGLFNSRCPVFIRDAVEIVEAIIK